MKKVDIKNFICFWEKYYDAGKYPDKIYFDFLEKEHWQNRDLDKIFGWKNGTSLSRKKKEILKKIYNNLEKISSFRGIGKPSETDFANFYKEVCCKIISSGLVWRIFLIHLTHPDTYPMVDKFNYIAYTFLAKNLLYNKSEADVDLQKNQLRAYRPFRKFIFVLNDEVNNLRKIDRALMAFGQFLVSPQKFLSSQFFLGKKSNPSSKAKITNGALRGRQGEELIKKGNKKLL